MLVTVEICSKSRIDTAINTIIEDTTMENTGVLVERLMALNKLGRRWSLAIAKEVLEDAITAVLIEESVASSRQTQTDILQLPRQSVLRCQSLACL